MTKTDEVTELRSELEKVRAELADLRAFVLPRELGAFKPHGGNQPKAWPTDLPDEKWISPYERELVGRARRLFDQQRDRIEAAHRELEEGIRLAREERRAELLAIAGDEEALAFVRETDLEDTLVGSRNAPGSVIVVVEHVRRRGSGDALAARGGADRVGDLLVAVLEPAEAQELLCRKLPRPSNGRRLLVVERGGADAEVVGELALPTITHQELEEELLKAERAVRGG